MLTYFTVSSRCSANDGADVGVVAGAALAVRGLADNSITRIANVAIHRIANPSDVRGCANIRFILVSFPMKFSPLECRELIELPVNRKAVALYDDQERLSVGTIPFSIGFHGWC